MIKNNFGNYVIQNCLKSTKNYKTKMMLVFHIYKNIERIGDKKIIEKWKNILIEAGLDLSFISESEIGKTMTKKNINNKNRKNNNYNGYINSNDNNYFQQVNPNQNIYYDNKNNYNYVNQTYNENSSQSQTEPINMNMNQYNNGGHISFKKNLNTNECYNNINQNQNFDNSEQIGFYNINYNSKINYNIFRKLF
jgi:hypothetical protein